MLSLYRLLVERLKAMVLADAGLDIEAEFAAQGASRKADLLRLAHGYEAEGLPEVAQELRDAVQGIHPDRPLACSLRIADDLHASVGEGKGALRNAPLESSEKHWLTDTTPTPDSAESSKVRSVNSSGAQPSQEEETTPTDWEEEPPETKKVAHKGKGRAKKK